MQTIPQPPQSLVLFCRFTQEPAQSTSGCEHDAAHAPLLQTCWFGHAFWQEPQCVGSVFKSTHTPLQLVCPLGHAHAPFTHWNPALHARPQPPQLRASVCVSTQLEPHWVCPLPHPPVHTPFEQVSPLPHLMPQPPQLFASALVFTHAPLQRMSPPLQPHTPPRQVVPLPQTFPHLPQSFESELRSTHELLHAVRPCPQDAAHAPLLQRGEAPEHVVPQPPQFFGSFARSTHAPLHDVVPGEHTHCEPLHVCVEAQASVHEPQCVLSEASSTHAPLQLLRPGLHEVEHAPTLQTSPLVHAAPHAPQLLGSLRRSAHLPPQLTWPACVHVPLTEPSFDPPSEGMLIAESSPPQPAYTTELNKPQVARQKSRLRVLMEISSERRLCKAKTTRGAPTHRARSREGAARFTRERACDGNPSCRSRTLRRP